MQTPTQVKHRRMRRYGKGWTREKSRIANAAKARYRMERDMPEREPVMLPWNRFIVTVRDRVTGEAASFELSSVRDATRRLAVMLRFCR